jgi:predicted metal-dependent hydrolase
VSTDLLTIGGVRVAVVRKRIKNLHLGVYPPEGRVRVAAPLGFSDEALRVAVIQKLPWIKRQQSKFRSQPRQSRREFVSGESHYFQGRRYRLNVATHQGPAHVAIRTARRIDLITREGSDAAQRERILLTWYRDQLKTVCGPMIERWEDALGVELAAWGIKRMKTKWGSCNAASRRIWLNLQLATKPIHCLEYVVVHELAHLIERTHDPRFTAIMDRHLPRWRSLRSELAAAPLEHETWTNREKAEQRRRRSPSGRRID